MNLRLQHELTHTVLWFPSFLCLSLNIFDFWNKNKILRRCIDAYKYINNCWIVRFIFFFLTFCVFYFCFIDFSPPTSLFFTFHHPCLFRMIPYIRFALYLSLSLSFFFPLMSYSTWIFIHSAKSPYVTSKVSVQPSMFEQIWNWIQPHPFILACCFSSIFFSL